MEYKNSIRRNIIEKRDFLNIDIKNKKDDVIVKKLLNSSFYINADVIFIYISFGSEINTIKIIEDATKNNKKVCIPKTYKNRVMKAIEIDNLNDLELNKFGILEPKFDLEFDKDKIDLVILPGLAFDLYGNRIGYGGGYYDRYLENSNLFKCVLAYDFQILEAIEASTHDIKFDYIISENREVDLKI